MQDSMYLQGNYAPIAEETTAFDLPVRGEIPAELNGRLLRIGPNPIHPGPKHHWFVGNGFVHGLQLREGRAAWYRSRFVRDDEVCAARGFEKTPGPRANDFNGGAVNTNVIVHAGRTYAIVEAGCNPVELSDELETVAYTDLEGSLPGAFSAHPKGDPHTGELHLVGYSPFSEYLQYVVVASSGRVRKTVDIPTPGRTMVHDCAITEHYVLVFDMPVLLDMEMAGAGYPLPYRWFADYGTRVGLLPRDGGAAELRWHEVEPCFVFHPMNAYESADGRVILDVVRHPKMFATQLDGPGEGPPTLERWTLDPKGGPVKEERIDERAQEFPRHDERRIGAPYRYGYCVAGGKGSLYGGLFKHDLQTGKTLHRDEGPSLLYQERVFVPRHAEAAEDEGWVLAYRHDAERDAADVVILDAQDFTGDPVATVQLPVRVPFGFHGNWAGDPA